MHISGFYATALFHGNAKKIASVGISAAFGASSAVFPILQVFNQFSNIGLQTLCTIYSGVVCLVLVNSFICIPWARLEQGNTATLNIRFWERQWWVGKVAKKPFLASVFDEVGKFEFWGESLFFSVNLFLLSYYLSTSGQLMYEKGDVKLTTEPNSWSDYIYARMAGWLNSLGFMWFPVVTLIMTRCKWHTKYGLTCLLNLLVVTVSVVPSLETQVLGFTTLSLSRLLLFSFHHAYIIEKVNATSSIHHDK